MEAFKSTMTPDPGEPDPALAEIGSFRTMMVAVRNRILSGLLLALPIISTIAILYLLYAYLQEWALDPLARLVSDYKIGGRMREQMPFWWDRVVAPLISFVLVLTILYFLGYLVRSRIVRMIDWILLRLPIVTTIYQAVSTLFQSLETQRQSNRFKRVVLVAFPHPGMRSLGLVTNSLKDRATGKTILCVVVLTGVIPPAGFTLFIPEEEVTDIDWTINQALQATLTGGLNSLGDIAYYPRPIAKDSKVAGPEAPLKPGS
ncbi:DUF502 domain-containing protein [soil metagenome]